MRKIIFTIASLLLVSHQLLAQCPQSTVTFQTQSDVDNFRTQYPNCRHLRVDVQTVSSTSNPVQDLSPLSQIRQIDGDLRIIGTSISSLQGLDNLQACEQLLISDNASLEDVSAISSLQSVGHLTIAGNSKIRDITAIRNIAQMESLTIGGFGLTRLVFPPKVEELDLLVISNCPKLQDVSAMRGVTLKGLTISNTGLRNLQGLEGLQHASFSIFLLGNNKLSSLDGLQNLRSMSGGSANFIHIQDNPNLLSLEKLSALRTVGDARILVRRNKNLTSIGGLASIDPSSIRLLEIRDNTSLAECSLTNFCTYLNSANASFVISGTDKDCSENSISQSCRGKP